MCVYIYIHTHIYIYPSLIYITWIYICMCVCVYIYIYIYTHTYHRSLKRWGGDRNEQKDYVKKWWLETSQIWREIWLSRWLKLLGPKQTQFKEDFTETHYNKTTKNQKIENFESSKEKETACTREPPQGYWWVSLQKPCRQGESGLRDLENWKKKLPTKHILSGKSKNSKINLR